MSMQFALRACLLRWKPPQHRSSLSSPRGREASKEWGEEGWFWYKQKRLLRRAIPALCSWPWPSPHHFPLPISGCRWRRVRLLLVAFALPADSLSRAGTSPQSAGGWSPSPQEHARGGHFPTPGQMATRQRGRAWVPFHALACVRRGRVRYSFPPPAPLWVLWSSSAAGALVRGHPASVRAVLPWATGKWGRWAAVQASSLSPGSAIAPLPSASPKKRLAQGTNKHGFFEGKAQRRGQLVVNQDWGQGVLGDELSCRQRQRPGVTLSARHTQGGPHGKDAVAVGCLFQLY